MDQSIQQLIEMLKAISPLVWDTLLRQAVMHGIMTLVWSGAFLITTIAAVVYGKINEKNRKDHPTVEGYYRQREPGPRDFEFLVKYVASYVTAGILFLFTIGALQEGLGYILNPQFQAIQYLIQSIK